VKNIKNLRTCLIIEVILAFILALLMYYVAKASNAMVLLSLPFDLIGKGLRWMSLNSAIGNAVAFVLYLIIALLPVIFLIIIRSKKGLRKPDIMLPVISLYNFYMLYGFINPNIMFKRMPELFVKEDFLDLIKMSFVLIFYALCLAYLIFRFLENLKGDSNKDRLRVLSEKLQRILAIIAVCYTFFLGYFAAFAGIKNIYGYLKLEKAEINCISVILTYVLEGLPIVFLILILLQGIKLLNTMVAKHLQEEESQAAVYLGVVSKRTVYVSISCNILLNAFQFLFSKQLSNVDYNLSISLTPLAIALTAMILSGYFKEAQKINDDNEMII